MLQLLPSLRRPVDERWHTAAAFPPQVRRIVHIPWTGVVLIVVDIGSEFAKGVWERHGWGVAVACEAAGLLGKSLIQPSGQHSGVMFDSHLVYGVLDGADCEVVDIVLDIPSLMQGRRWPGRTADERVGGAGWMFAEAFHV